MNRRMKLVLFAAVLAILWTTGAGAAEVRQRDRGASSRGLDEHGQRYERAPDRHDAHDSHRDRDDWRDERHDDVHRRQDRDEHPRDRYDDDAPPRRSGGGVIMRQPHEHEHYRRPAPGYGPYGPYGPNDPYRPYGPYDYPYNRQR